MKSHDTNAGNQAELPKIYHESGNRLDDALKAHSLGFEVIPGDPFNPKNHEPLTDREEITRYWCLHVDDDVWIKMTLEQLVLEIYNDIVLTLDVIKNSSFCLAFDDKKYIIYKASLGKIYPKKMDVYPGVNINNKNVFCFQSRNIVWDISLNVFPLEIKQLLNLVPQSHTIDQETTGSKVASENPLFQYCSLFDDRK